MKKSKLFLGALSLLAFAACSDDKNAPIPEQVLNDGSESYITVRIFDAMSAFGRADGDFENGDKIEDGTSIYDENSIQSIKIAFYDANKNFIAYGDAKNGDISQTPNPNGSNVEAIGKAKVTLTLKPDQAVPRYAIAFANPLVSYPTFSNVKATQESDRNSYWNSTEKEGKTTYHFAMNNSVYFSEKGEMQVAVPVSEKNFYKGETAPEGTPEVDFYIERIAGKVVLKGTASDNSIDVENHVANVDDPEEKQENKKYLVFVPEKWGINAEERKTHTMKCFTQEYQTLTDNLKWGDALWNDPVNHRSYWAHSISFGKDNFPKVSDDLKIPEEKIDNSDSYNLIYHSYKDIEGNGAAFGSPLYTFENTNQVAAFNNNSALVSAIVIGHYEIRDAANQEVEPTTFYRRNKAILSEDGFWAAMAGSQQLFFKQKEVTESEIKYESLSAEELKKVAEVYHPTKTFLADKIAENQVSIRVQDDYATKLANYYIKTGEKTYVKYEEAKSTWTKDEMNKYLLQICGLSDVYTDGKAYFNIPIRHLGIEKENNALSAGYYGVVRNHTYEISVTKIKGTNLGTGIFKDTQPIVPSTSTDEYNINANFNVLAWRLVPQSVILGE